MSRRPLSAVRKIHAYHNELWLPPGYRPKAEGLRALDPTCAVCTKKDGGTPHPVDAVEIVEEGSKRIDVKVRCHGEEDALRITWEDDGCTLSDFLLQLQKTVFFHGKQDR